MYSLELIKKKKIIDGGSPEFLTKEEIKWLIEKAERVEELQETIINLQEFISNRNDDIDFYLKVFKQLNSVIKPIAEPDGYDY